MTTHPGYIGVFDSGIGGLSVANAISGLLPAERLLYVADNARAPYGPQPPELIVAYSREITRFLLKRGAKMIVVACNTATSLAIDRLREEFTGLPFVGLEPAVKPASSELRIGVMATAATLASDRYQALKERYLGEKFVVENACEGLVPIIEAAAPGSPRLLEKLSGIITPMVAGGVDTIVLGCTHYPMVKEDIKHLAGPGVRVIDPSPAAARQVRRLLDDRAATSDGPTGEAPATGLGAPPLPGTRARAHDFYCTGDAVSLQRALYSLPSLNRGRRVLCPGTALNL